MKADDEGRRGPDRAARTSRVKRRISRSQQAKDGEEECGEPTSRPNVSPEEQKQYDNVVVAALSFIYSNGATKMVVQKLTDESKPPGSIQKAIGHTTAMILLSVNGSIEKRGGQVSKDVIFAAGQEVIAELLTIAENAGLGKADDMELVKNSMFEAVKAYGDAELRSGELGKDERAQAQREYAQLRGDSQGASPGLVNGAAQAPQDQGAA
jgi:hypothetical protein